MSHPNPYVNLANLLDNFTLSPLRGKVATDDNRSFDISRWNIKYNGLTSVNNFLERIEEIRRSRGVSKQQLLRAAPELFDKDALLWFRTCSFETWDELVFKLKEAFQPYDYDYSLWDEIRRRTQGSQERVLSFVVAMENLFRKLSDPPSEQTKLQLIRRNLLPYIQSRLAICPVNSIAELLRLSRGIEETETRVQRFQPPPTNYRHLLEPELAYHRPLTNPVAAVEEPCSDASREFPNINAVSGSIKPPHCWNCKKSGHRFRQCTQPKRRFCFKCGRDEVTSRSCPVCSKNDHVGRS